MDRLFAKRRNLILFLFIGIYVILWPIFYTFIPSSNSIQNRLIIELTISLFCIFLYCWGNLRNKKSIELQNTTNGKNFGRIILIALSSIALAFLLYLLNSRVCQFTSELTMKYGVNRSSGLQFSTTIQSYLYLLGGIIVGPIVEEIVYRKLLYGVVQNFIRGYSPVISILVTSIIFGASHLVGQGISTGNPYVWIQVLNYLLPGVLFQILAIRQNSLMGSILTHILYNALCFV